MHKKIAPFSSLSLLQLALLVAAVTSLAQK